ncbi:HU family DNA-binding protein [uncultured Roseobacter sp.]|uniref:HU family DNA-binding protein n=1 Tax=uncultured Roseobacter sp. TaxID=114847 RepID=UPI00262F3AE0|nr:HU family DNA-binding protein [uncultured Roseobacter sp.]
MSTAKDTSRKGAPRAKARSGKAAPKPKSTTKTLKAPATDNISKVALGTGDANEQSTTLRKKELIESVVARTGLKKRDAKPVVEAMLAELGESLAAGRSLNLPPLGRVRINREKTLANGRVMIVKVRQTNPPLKAKTPADEV